MRCTQAAAPSCLTSWLKHWQSSSGNSSRCAQHTWQKSSNCVQQAQTLLVMRSCRRKQNALLDVLQRISQRVTASKGLPEEFWATPFSDASLLLSKMPFECTCKPLARWLVPMSGLCPPFMYCPVLLLVQAGNHGHGKCGLPIVGFCFSFAMEQQALNSGKLLVWSKGFTVEGVLGEDVVALLSGTAAPPLG